VKKKPSAYNFRMRTQRCLWIVAKAFVNAAVPPALGVLPPRVPALKRRAISSRPLRRLDSSKISLLRSASLILALLLTVIAAAAQQPQSADAISITTKDVPAATLWNPYSFRLEATGGIELYHWHVVSGSLPRNLELHSSGEITGIVNQQGQFDFAVQAAGDSGAPSKPKQLTLNVETPLTAVWSRKSQVNGQRIDGSIKVSNTTGRDFDLTSAVLAVNDIGRATAIGYQHFPLKKNTREMELPFGDTLSPGTYVVNVDVVGEEPVSKMIFRTRLVTPTQSITQGP
jgi:Putative Ig domain